MDLLEGAEQAEGGRGRGGRGGAGSSRIRSKRAITNMFVRVCTEFYHKYIMRLFSEQ